MGGNVTRVLASDLDALSSQLSSNFKYDTGPYQDYAFDTPSKRYLAKLDYNLNDRNKVSFRYLQLDSESPILLSNSSSLGWGSRRTSTTGLNFSNSNYAILENIKSGVAEWNSILSSNMANSLIVGYTTNDESRPQKGDLFPFVDILNAGTVYTSFGFEPFTPRNQLRYKTFQIQDSFTWNRGSHAFTFGGTVEKYHSDNVFFSDAAFGSRGSSGFHLAVTGVLILKRGGPSVYPPIPEEVLAGQSRPEAGWGNSPPDEAARRSVYIHVKRSLLMPILSSYDVADTDSSCPVRYTTSVPGQALGMMNSEFLNQQAALLAKRLRRERPDAERAQVELAIRLITGGKPSGRELDEDLKFIDHLRLDQQLSADAALVQYCLLDSKEAFHDLQDSQVPDELAA